MGKEGASRGKGSSIGGKMGGGVFFKKNDAGHTKPAYKQPRPAGGPAQKEIGRDGGTKSVADNDRSHQERQQDYTAPVDSGDTTRRRGCFLTGCALPAVLAVSLAVLAVSLAW